MKFLLFLSIAWLLTSEAWAIYGPEFKTSNPQFHRRRAPKVASHDGYKLPGNARPHSYEVSLTLTPFEYVVTGEVFITLDVDPSETRFKTTKLQLTSEVELDSNMTFLWNETMYCQFSTIGGVFFEIECPESIEGEGQTLRITYATHYGAGDEAGMYDFYYKDNGDYKYMVTTQLEQDYARRLFPCFDEPEYKAPVKLTLITDKAVQGYDISHWISNTKVESETVNGNVVTTTFQQTPNMSLYLLAFVATPDFINFTNPDLKANYEFEIFARPDAENYLNIALNNGPKLIDLMGNFTGIPYPSLGIDRMVLAAIPEFRAGAMENWGLITFREQILIDEGSQTTARDKQYIVQVIAHELAHQWFGDYVTLDWWSETWLNEGFAQYFEYYLPDQLESDYDMARQFVVKEKQQVLKTDGFPDSIPLTNNNSEVTTETDFSVEFGDVSYIKGASIIKILHQVLGDDAFQKGLQAYLTNNKFGNPSSNILINTLQTQVPVEKLDLNILFNKWIYQSGYPLLDVSLAKNNKVTIKATKFSSSLNKTNENNTADWWLPLTYTTSDKRDFNITNFEWPHTSALPNFSLTLSNDAWIILNLQSIGYYRVNYDQTLWDRIITVLNNSKTFSTVDVLNRAQLLDDIFNVAKSYQTDEENGNLYYLTAFKLAEYLQYETEYYPWYTFFTEMHYLYEIIQDEETLSALNEKILKVLSPQVVIPSAKDNLTHIQILKRSLLLKWACKLGHEKCTQWANTEFQNYKANTSSIDNNYRDIIICTGLTLSNGSRNDYKTLLTILENSNLPHEQSDLVNGLTCLQHDDLIQDFLEKTIDTIPNRPPFSRMFNVQIINTLISSGFEKVKSALKFVLTRDNDITQYWQSIDTPETLFKTIASKIYNQKHVDMFNEYIEKNKDHKEYQSKIEAAKEAVEIAKENIEYLNQYSSVLKSVIVYNGQQVITTEPPPKTTTHTSSSTKVETKVNIVLAFVSAYLLKYIVS